MTSRAVCLTTLLATLVGTAPAQLISIKTVPVAQGDQFDIFPSMNLGMAGVSIALADTLLDPFVNPAKGARLGAARFFGSPAFFSVSREAGGGRTLPLGALAPSGSWYGGLLVALQEVDAGRRSVPPPPGILRDVAMISPVVPQSAPDQRPHGNAFAYAMLGKVLPGPGGGLSLAGSVLWAGLTAIDGVDELYAGSQGVKQLGHEVDVRFGVLKQWAGDRSLEALVLHSRFEMTHDVTYFDLFWDPGTQQTLLRPRLEHNLDRTNTWGLHLAHQRPLSASGWRIGWLATGNRMSHPKIPNYEIMNIPRDPGYSSAFDVGVGVSRVRGPATFGLDAIFEPIWSTTWADAAAPVVTRLGATIPSGGRTIENRFHFSNALLRLGVGRALEPGRVAGRGGRATTLQLGLLVRSVRYRLDQLDYVQVSGRTQREWWLEWTPTWGLSLRFPDLEIRYHGRVTHGTGRPGVAQNPFVLADRTLASGGILVAPSGPLTLDEVRVTTHQISVALPLR